MKKILMLLSLLMVGMFLVGCTTGEAVRPAATKTTLVKANSCDADELCEAKIIFADSATLQGTLTANHVQTSGITVQGGTLELGKYPDYAAALTIHGEQYGPISAFNGQVIIGGLLDVRDTTKLKYLTISELAGEGNAYVCVDYVGTLFRSDTPCK